MRRLFTIIVLLMTFAMLGAVVWVANHLDTIKPSQGPRKQSPAETSPPASSPVPGR
ncbi:hypothetical protein JIN84_02515 [Luteolibacter yonseiensis]|uniref:Uncharacterized protein n=1 Tax=Luteolibacter yonseiensis TaxID=1144680 RepID=A0A934R0G3_9BACT|nr:hypothetical protein [Luteolibacter yonseiensis]MBK1814469.1 hypothetical protein [Luteolibacter yonseiensis]